MKKNSKMLLALAMSFAMLAGCSDSSSTEETENTEITEEAAKQEEEKEKTVLGKEVDDTVLLSLTNKTGKAIVSMSYQINGEGEYIDLLKEGEEIEKNAEFDWYAIQPESETTESGLELAGCLNVKIKLDDDTVFTLHTLYPEGLEDVEDLCICLKDEIGYLTYTDGEDEIDTYETEKALAGDESEEQAEDEAVEEDLNAEEVVTDSYSEPAQETTTYSQPDTSYTYSEPSYSYSEPSYSEPSYSAPSYDYSTSTDSAVIETPVVDAPAADTPVVDTPVVDTPSVDSSSSEGCLGPID